MPDLASSKQKRGRFRLHALHLMICLNSNRKALFLLSLIFFSFLHDIKRYFGILAGEQIDRWKQQDNMELNLYVVEYGHLSACCLMATTDLPVWRIKLQAFRRAIRSQRGC